MRAARLLQMLLLLQNRGRMTSADLAEELECSRRTVLRDVDAMTEAGLPVIVHQGNQGGIELGFDYRTRLAAFDADEAAALGIILATSLPALEALGLVQAGARVQAKLREAFSDVVRDRMAEAASAFNVTLPEEEVDPRVPALARAIRGRHVVRLNAQGSSPVVVHPVGLDATPDGWRLRGVDGQSFAVEEAGAVNISAKRF